MVESYMSVYLRKIEVVKEHLIESCQNMHDEIMAMKYRQWSRKAYYD